MLSTRGGGATYQKGQRYILEKAVLSTRGGRATYQRRRGYLPERAQLPSAPPLIKNLCVSQENLQLLMQFEGDFFSSMAVVWRVELDKVSTRTRSVTHKDTNLKTG